jgi:hypothetical protein
MKNNNKVVKKMKIKRMDLVKFYSLTHEMDKKSRICSKCGDSVVETLRLPFKFQYALNKNREKIYTLQAAIEQQAHVPEYTNYIQEMTMFESTLAEKDEEGQPIIIQTQYHQHLKVPIFKYPAYKEEETKKHEEERKKLNEKYKDAIEEFKVKVKNHNEALQEEIEFDFYTVKEDIVPNVTRDQAEVISYMVEDIRN